MVDRVGGTEAVKGKPSTAEETTPEAGMASSLPARGSGSDSAVAPCAIEGETIPEDGEGS